MRLVPCVLHEYEYNLRFAILPLQVLVSASRQVRRLQLQPQLELLKRQNREASLSLISARAQANTKAAGALDRARSKADAKLHDERAARQKEIARLKDEARAQREASRQSARELSCCSCDQRQLLCAEMLLLLLL